MMFRLWLYLSAAALLSACASGPGGGGRYDPNARETLGTVLERRDTGTTTRQPRSMLLVPVGGLVVPMSTDPGSGPLPVYEHNIALDDGRTVTVFSWYPEHPVGGCVKLFESPRADYPRMINHYGCKPRK
jgi:hypothetical protein